MRSAPESRGTFSASLTLMPLKRLLLLSGIAVDRPYFATQPVGARNPATHLEERKVFAQMPPGRPSRFREMARGALKRKVGGHLPFREPDAGGSPLSAR